MATYFGSRHPGARDWVEREGIDVDLVLAHLDPVDVVLDETLIGSLPVHLAADVCTRGARYLHLSLELPAALRGRERSADEMGRLGARVEEFRVERLTREETAL